VVLFLEKPFQISRLIEEVGGYFTRRQQPEPPPAAAPSAAEPEPNSLVHFKLQDLVQLFCLNGRNILVTVTAEEGHATGEIYIQRGCVIHADFNGKIGDEAFFALMQLPNPLLKVRDCIDPVPITVESKWEHLLLQSAIAFDHHK